MRGPRISLARLMVLVAVLAVDWFVLRNALSVSERVSRHNLSLSYSWSPDVQQIPKGEPFYADQFAFLDSVHISGVLSSLALGVTPMASLLGLGCVVLLRQLAVCGRCSFFLVGFVVSGSAVLFSYAGCCILAIEVVGKYAEAAITLVLYLPAQILRGVIGNETGLAIYLAAALFVLGLPQVLVALLGGLINERKLRVTLVVIPRASDEMAVPGVR